jgi:hypothetical protein
MEMRETGRTQGLHDCTELPGGGTAVSGDCRYESRIAKALDVRTDGTLNLQCRKPRTMYLLPSTCNLKYSQLRPPPGTASRYPHVFMGSEFRQRE